MNQTPRTDSEAKRPGFLSDWEVFARELERENNNLKKLIKDLQEGDYYKLHYDSVVEQWGDCVKERDALKAELEQKNSFIAAQKRVVADLQAEVKQWQQVAESLANRLIDNSSNPLNEHLKNEALAEFEKLKEGK